MSTATDVLKKHWEKGAVVVAIAFEVAVAFEHHLAEISLEVRFMIIGIAGLTVTASVAEMLRWKPKRASVGFHPESTKGPNISVARVALCSIAILSSSAISMFMLNETVTFHNIRILQKMDSSDPAVGIIEIQPAHMPANLAVNFSTSQTSNNRILDKAPASWNDQDPVDWRMENDTPYGVTFLLRDFKNPQVFGCWYRLSPGAEGLGVDVTADPANVRVLRSNQLYKYRLNIWIFGGFLCLAALLFWFYRSCWFQSPT